MAQSWTELSGERAPCIILLLSWFSGARQLFPRPPALHTAYVFAFACIYVMVLPGWLSNLMIGHLGED